MRQTSTQSRSVARALPGAKDVLYACSVLCAPVAGAHPADRRATRLGTCEQVFKRVKVDKRVQRTVNGKTSITWSPRSVTHAPTLLSFPSSRYCPDRQAPFPLLLSSHVNRALDLYGAEEDDSLVP